MILIIRFFIKSREHIYLSLLFSIYTCIRYGNFRLSSFGQPLSSCLFPDNLFLIISFRTIFSQLSLSGQPPPSCLLPDNYPPYSLRITLSQSLHKYKSSNEYWCSMGTRFSPSVSHSMPQCSGGYKLSVGLLSCKGFAGSFTDVKKKRN